MFYFEDANVFLKKKRKCFKEEIKIKTGSLNEKYFKPISILFVKSIKESKEKKTLLFK